MTLTKHESSDSAVPRADNTGSAGASVAEASERFRLDIPRLFQRQEAQESQEPLRLAHAGHGGPERRGNSPALSDTTEKGERAGEPGPARTGTGDRRPGHTERATVRDRESERLNPSQFNELARTNGLELRTTPDKKLEFSLTNRGEKLVIGSVEPTHAGLQEIAKSLKEFSELKKWDLEQRFGVQFAAPGGEQRIHQQIQQADGSPKAGKELALREPNLRELLGIEAALEKANPSHKADESGKPLTFYFLKDSTYYQGAGGVATFEPNLNGTPAVIVEPKALMKTPITERDRPNQDTGDHRSIESVIIHELGHHTEEKVAKTPQEKAEIYRQLGWTPIPGMPASPNGDQQWMLRGRNGEGYAPAGVTPGRWVRFDQNGREKGTLSPEQAANLAQVKPPTRYFEGPHEVLAESLTMLRLGDGHRSQLLRNDAGMYESIKALDQRELDKAYGAGKFMRSYSGQLVPQNSDNLRLLKEREERERSAGPARRH